jgi:putative DNA methylase
MKGVFIENPRFPIAEVNDFSAREKKGGGRPEFWEMVFWWTRKPLIGARSVIAGALLPYDFNLADFKRLVRLGSNTRVPHRENPHVSTFTGLRERFSKVSLLDPFAGFGSIPLEAVRLNLGSVVAAELLPTAYVFLKAVLEYPKTFGKRLIEDVKYWGEWIIRELERDPDIKELYDEDVAVYIGTWEVKCPYCGRYTPLVGNWWLARVSGKMEEEEEWEAEEEGVKSGEFKRLAWMEPYISSNTVGIRIVDLNKELRTKIIKAEVNAKQGFVKIAGNRYGVPRPNIDARRKTATCLLCNNQIKGAGEKWYVKEALREYNEKLEKYLRGEISLEELLNSRARPRLLVKVKIVNNDLEFEPATQEDNEKLWRALEKLRAMWGDPDIPTELLAEYEKRQLMVCTSTGACKWYQVFNPRQLLTLVKLVKLVREAGKRVEEERLRQGWGREDAYKYAEAVTTYLAIALLKHVNYNSIVTSTEPTQKFIRDTLAFRGIAMTWNWVEEKPYVNIIGSYIKSLNSVTEGLSYLVNAVSDSSSRVRVLLDDATSLSKLGEEKFDLIVTDPPYRDDVPYAELSDFYYVWLKRALSDVAESFGLMKLAPRFHRDAFFDEFGNEIETQWKAFALKEVSESEGRIEYFVKGGNSFEYFKALLSNAFKAMASRLRDDGLLVTYYAHTSPDAWEALLEAGWLNSKMRIATTHPIVTESAESVVARGKVRLDISIIAVWKKGVKGVAHVDEVYAKAVEQCSRDAHEYRKMGFEGINLFVAVLGRVLSVFTSYERLVGVKPSNNKSYVGELVEKYIYPATTEAIARAFGATGTRFSPTLTQGLDRQLNGYTILERGCNPKPPRPSRNPRHSWRGGGQSRVE